MAFTRIATSAERIVYRIAGLPVAVSALLDSRPGDPLKSAFAWRYWRPNDAGEWVELAIGLVTWPVAVPLGAAWFTLRNGAVIRRRNGKGMARQLAEQLKLYFTAGVLAPWYYIFSLYEDGGTARARTYLQRFETKPSLFMMLKRKGGSPLNDKVRFADYCAERGIRCVPTLVHLNGQRTDATLPDRIEDTIDYSEVCQVTTLVAQQRTYRTLERLCAAIADRLIDQYAADAVWVKAAKPEPPMALPVSEVSVEVWREAS